MVDALLFQTVPVQPVPVAGGPSVPSGGAEDFEAALLAVDGLTEMIPSAVSGLPVARSVAAGQHMPAALPQGLPGVTWPADVPDPTSAAMSLPPVRVLTAGDDTDADSPPTPDVPILQGAEIVTNPADPVLPPPPSPLLQDAAPLPMPVTAMHRAIVHEDGARPALTEASLTPAPDIPAREGDAVAPVGKTGNAAGSPPEGSSPIPPESSVPSPATPLYSAEVTQPFATAAIPVAAVERSVALDQKRADMPRAPGPSGPADDAALTVVPVPPQIAASAPLDTAPATLGQGISGNVQPANGPSKEAEPSVSGAASVPAPSGFPDNGVAAAHVLSISPFTAPFTAPVTPSVIPPVASSRPVSVPPDAAGQTAAVLLSNGGAETVARADAGQGAQVMAPTAPVEMRDDSGATLQIDGLSARPMPIAENAPRQDKAAKDASPAPVAIREAAVSPAPVPPAPLAILALDAPPVPVPAPFAPLSAMSETVLPPAPAPAAPQTVVPVDTLPALLVSHTDGGPAEIYLEPIELGRLRLDVVADGQEVQVTLAAERSDTSDLIRRYAAELQAEFRQAGFVQVTIGFGAWAEGRGQSRPQDPPPAVQNDPAPFSSPQAVASVMSINGRLPARGLNLRL